MAGEPVTIVVRINLKRGPRREVTLTTSCLSLPKFTINTLAEADETVDRIDAAIRAEIEAIVQERLDGWAETHRF